MFPLFISILCSVSEQNRVETFQKLNEFATAAAAGVSVPGVKWATTR